MYMCINVYIHISKYIILKIVTQNKKILALKNIKDIQNFFQIMKSGNSYLSVLNMSRQNLSFKGPACALKLFVRV